MTQLKVTNWTSHYNSDSLKVSLIFVGVAQPSVGVAQLSVGLAQPSVGEAQPSVGVAQPNEGVAQPGVGVAQPSVCRSGLQWLVMVIIKKSYDMMQQTNRQSLL